MVEDQTGFREMFRMDVMDFEFILVQISDLIQSYERLGWTNPTENDERLALTLHCLVAGESFQSLSINTESR